MEEDSLKYWGPMPDDNWTMDFPAGAKLVVVGENIYAVKYQEKSVTLQKVYPPSSEK